MQFPARMVLKVPSLTSLYAVARPMLRIGGNVRYGIGAALHLQIQLLIVHN